MKRCPQCQTDYFDNMLEFCLDDGVKLITFFDPASKTTKQLDKTTNETETVINLKGELAELSELKESSPANIQNALKEKSEVIKHSFTNLWYQILEFAPIVTALIHNFWQWLYLPRIASLQMTGYIFSAEFIIWLILFFATIILGIFSIKFGKTQKLAIISLVVLAINALLIIIPK